MDPTMVLGLRYLGMEAATLQTGIGLATTLETRTQTPFGAFARGGVGLFAPGEKTKGGDEKFSSFLSLVFLFFYMSDFYTYQDLFKAYKNCIKSKGNTMHAIGFSYSLEKELLQLQYDLQSKKYELGRSICFVVEEPVIREIFAAPFRDRVVQHFLIEKIETIFEKYFIYTSCACRKNKGTHFALRQLKKGIQKVSNNYQKKLWYLKMDISGFFMNMNKELLFKFFKEILEKESVKNKKIADQSKELLWLAKTIIFHDPTQNFYKKGQLSLFDAVPKNKSLFSSPHNTGLPIGNLTSQFFANVYLNPLDQFVKRILKCVFYVRYVDDFVLLSENKHTLLQWEQAITSFCKKHLSLTTHPHKTIIQPVCNGIDFVGYKVFPKHVLVRQRSVHNAKAKFSENIASLNSYLGLFRHANSFTLRKKHITKIIAYFHESIQIQDKRFLAVTKRKK